MNRAETEQVLRDLIAARLTNDANAVCAFFHNDASYAIAGDDKADTISGAVHGEGAFAETLVAMAAHWKWQKVELRTIMIDGAKAVVRYRLTTQFNQTGEIVESEVCDYFKFRSTKIAKTMEYIDTGIVNRVIAPAST